MTTRSSGRATETKASRALEARGYFGHHAQQTNTTRDGKWFSHSNDLFGVFDLMMVRRAPKSICMIQVTVRGSMSARKKKVAEVAGGFPDLRPAVTIEVWGFVQGTRRSGGQCFRVERWTHDGWEFSEVVEVPA